MIKKHESGAIHILSIGILLILLATMWIFMGWQQHLDRVHAQVEVMQQKIELLELRIKVLEGKVTP